MSEASPVSAASETSSEWCREPEGNYRPCHTRQPKDRMPGLWRGSGLMGRRLGGLPVPFLEMLRLCVLITRLFKLNSTAKYKYGVRLPELPWTLLGLEYSVIPACHLFRKQPCHLVTRIEQLGSRGRGTGMADVGRVRYLFPFPPQGYIHPIRAVILHHDSLTTRSGSPETAHFHVHATSAENPFAK
jgi:hypothetical protein